MRKLRFLMPLGFIAIAAGFITIVMLLWNWLMPVIFGLVTINFWQALGILVLCRILFGSFGGNKMKRGMHDKNVIRERWMKMTPEQREEFIKERRTHMGPFNRHSFFRGNDSDCNTSKENE